MEETTRKSPKTSFFDLFIMIFIFCFKDEENYNSTQANDQKSKNLHLQKNLIHLNKNRCKIQSFCLN
jgi:hypothetical protein